MSKKFVVEDVRVTGWSLRLRNTVTGETLEVPMNPGARFASPDIGETGEEGRRGRQEHGEDSSNKDAPAPARNEQSRRPRKKKAHTNGTGAAARAERAVPPVDPSSPWAPGKPNPLETHEGRMMPVDEKSLTAADRKVIDEHQQFWAHIHNLKSQKRGKLGWEETTDAGRSGLRARHKSGAFKILHAGGDVYALFYEWDSGKFVKIACGKAEDMMNLADERTREKLMPPPRTILDLEMARHMCSSDPQQRQIAAERLEPVFREGIQLNEDDAAPPTPQTRRQSPRRAAAPSPTPVSEPATTTAVPPSSPAAGTEVDAQRDETLKATFAQALAEMEDE